MTKTLIIVESPSKSKTIEKYLSNGYKVIASVGHFRDLPKHELGVDINNNFKPTYIIMPEKKHIVNKIIEEAKKSDIIYLAPDPDREGEAIAWHLAFILRHLKKPIRRLTFNEITKTAILKALNNTRNIDLNLVNAQQTRRIIDRIVGYKTSDFLRSKIVGGTAASRNLSAGRVQTIVLKLVCERETKLETFVRSKYFTITGIFNDVEAKLIKINNNPPHITFPTEAEFTKSQIEKNKHFTVSDINETISSSPVIKPFITATLQRSASSKLGFTPEKTMKIAQQLYEGIDIGPAGRTGLITYMRTDSYRISEEFAQKAKVFIEDNYGSDYVLKQPVKVKLSATAQDAHEAIRPTLIKIPSELKNFLTPDQHKLYELIWNRFIASQMEPPKSKILTVEFSASGFTFQTKVSKTIFDGYMKILSTKQSSQGIPETISDFKKGQKVLLKEIVIKENLSNIPLRYTHAELVKDLEKKGIGRPSTYATVIGALFKRSYAITKKLKNKEYIIPVEKGKKVKKLLTSSFPNIFQVHFTANMETQLDKIEAGRQPMNIVLNNFYNSFSAELKNAIKFTDKIVSQFEKTGEKCPKCGKDLIYRHSKKGEKFIACSGYPDCNFTKPISVKKCPHCGQDMVIRKGPYGKFIACTHCTHKENLSTKSKRRKAS